MTPTVNADLIGVVKTLELLQNAVDDRGADYVYPQSSGSCLYVHRTVDGVKYPGCIAAHVFNQAGVPMTEMEAYEHRSTELVGPLFGFTDDASHVLSRAQRLQDHGRTWGVAVESARKYATDNHWL